MGISYPQGLGIRFHGYPRAKRNGDNLSTKSVDKSSMTTSIVESVENLSTFIVDNSYITAWLVDNVDKLFTKSVDKSDMTTSIVENVENLSTNNVDKWKGEKKEKNH